MTTTRENRVECPRCGAKFYTPLALMKHQRRAHGYIPALTRREQAALKQRVQAESAR